MSWPDEEALDAAAAMVDTMGGGKQHPCRRCGAPDCRTQVGWVNPKVGSRPKYLLPMTWVCLDCYVDWVGFSKVMQRLGLFPYRTGAKA